MKLLDIFEPVVCQIDTFDSIKFASAYPWREVSQVKIEEGVKLFQKPTNVKKVLFPGRNQCIDQLLLNAISSGSNKNIQSFTVVGEDNFQMSDYDHCVLNYIKNVRNIDPCFDTGRIDHVFSIYNV